MDFPQRKNHEAIARPLFALAGLLLGVVCTASAETAPVALRPLPSPDQWRVEPGAWVWNGDVLRGCSKRASFAVSRDATVSKSVVVEARAVPGAVVSDNWKTFGVVVYLDPRNFWFLCLGESPNAQNRTHWAGLTEMRDGRRHAEKSLEQTDAEGSGRWRLGRSYDFRLELTPGRIEGTIRDDTGAIVLRRAYRLGEEGVGVGRPALRIEGTDTAFSRLRAFVGTPSPGPEEIVYPPFPSRPAMAGIRARATGHFRVEEIDGRWWVIDPNGNATLALGVDHVRYKGFWCEALKQFPYKLNNDARYGSRAAWEEQTLRRLKAWNFNLLSIGSDASLRRRGLAHTLILNAGYQFATLGDAFDITPYQGHPGSVFPNVFHPDFRAWLDYYMEEICSPNAGDPWLFGYFLDNELAWWGRDHTSWCGLFDAAMGKPATHSAKRALRDFLRGEYTAVEKMNRAWGLDLESWDDVLARDNLGDNDNPEVARVKEAFAGRIAEIYFRETTAALRRHDPNHMILGCRFPGGRASNGIWRAAGKYCDVVSFNYYGSVDLDTREARSDVRDNMAHPLTWVLNTIHDQCRRPMLISEWSFVALDSGLPCTHGAGQRFRTQAERAAAAEIHLTTILRTPFMVGSCFFMYVDEPALGIRSAFPENSNYGLVDIHDQPYRELVEVLTRVQSRAGQLHMMGPVPEKPGEAARSGAPPIPREWRCADASTTASFRTPRQRLRGLQWSGRD